MNNQTYEDFLASEVKRMGKSTRNRWMMGGVMLLVLTLYFGFILTMVKTFAEPEVAAILLVRNLKSSYPDVMKTAEEHLSDQSVVLAEELSRSFLETVPAMREEAEAYLEKAHRDVIPHMSQEFQEVISAYIAENREAIQLLAEQEDDPEFTKVFVEDIMGKFRNLLNESMEKEFQGRDLSYIKQNSVVTLHAINTYLDELIATDPEEMTRSQEVHVQLLATLTKLSIRD